MIGGVDSLPMGLLLTLHLLHVLVFWDVTLVFARLWWSVPMLETHRFPVWRIRHHGPKCSFTLGEEWRTKMELGILLCKPSRNTAQWGWESTRGVSTDTRVELFGSAMKPALAMAIINQ